MKKILLSILMCCRNVIASMESQRSLLLDYTFAACSPKKLIENLEQHAVITQNFDKSGKFFQELVYHCFSTQDVQYLIKVVASHKEI